MVKVGNGIDFGIDKKMAIFWPKMAQKWPKNGQFLAKFFFHLMAHFPLTIAGTTWNKTLDFLKNDEFKDFILETAKIMIFGQNAVGFLAIAVLIFNLFWQNLHQLWCLKGFRGMRWNFWKILKIGHFMAKKWPKMAIKWSFMAKIQFFKNSPKSHLLSPTYPKRTVG